MSGHVDQIDGAVAEHRREQRVARLGARRIAGDEPRARSPDLLLVDGRHARHWAPILGQGARRRASFADDSSAEPAALG